MSMPKTEVVCRLRLEEQIQATSGKTDKANDYRLANPGCGAHVLLEFSFLELSIEVKFLLISYQPVSDRCKD